MNTLKPYFNSLLSILLIFSITACSGGDDPAVEEIVLIGQNECVTMDDENQDDNCGTLLLGFTDADGDFLSYNVAITGLEMIRADGTQVSVIPTSQSINFSDYIEISELAAAATIPAGVYTSGSITIDYTNADIQVEKSGEATAAKMVDAEGNLLTTTTLQLQLDEGNQLIINRGRPAVLEVDFNLAASHTIDLDSDPVTVTTEPFIIAEVDPIIKKERRLRGLLLRVNQPESYFRIAVRPFHRTDGRFGGVNVRTNDATSFEIDGGSYRGAEGLAQMANLDPDSPTITWGKFERATDSFTAIMVVAGSSVPGADKDGVAGVIVARSGNNLLVKGASLVRTDGRVSYNREINVLIGETTQVSKNRRLQDEVNIDDLSIGQAVTVLGTLTEQDDALFLDATEGFIRMRLTSASGHAISEDGLILNMNLQALQGRRPGTYDFSGTGIDENFDATADNYEISIANLVVNNLAANDPIRVLGFINGFGSAPADFNALTVINYADSRSQILANWPTGDGVVAFSEITSEKLTLNVEGQAESGVYKLIQGGIRSDITDFDMAVDIIPFAERGFYTLKNTAGIVSFSNFADFSSYLQLKLNEGESVDLMHAVGGFSFDNKTLSARKIAIKLN